MKNRVIFIHALFRCGSTYLFDKFRQNDKFLVYYEPLHHILEKISKDNIDIWNFYKNKHVGHKDVKHPRLDKPHFFEFQEVFNGCEKLPYFDSKFSYQEFFSVESHEQFKSYIDNLIVKKNKICVLQFNRTSLRIDWFKKNYPDALNIYLLRNPRDQFQSYIDRGDINNNIFLAINLYIYILNKKRFLNFDFQNLEINMQDDIGENLKECVKICKNYSLEDHYRIFIYIWYLSFQKALKYADLIIDMNKLSYEKLYLHSIERKLFDFSKNKILFTGFDMKTNTLYSINLEKMKKQELMILNKMNLELGVKDDIKKLLQKYSYPTTKITIITVVYNAKDDLEKTILSVINQTYPNIEYIIIDGGSTDGTLDIIKKYEDKITHWISEPDDGIYDAMNKGIDLATGEWINFMNAGDTFYNESVVERVFEYNVEGYDFVYGDRQLLNNGKKFKLNKAKTIDNVNKHMPFGHQACFISTKIHKEIKYNLFYELSADYDFILRCYMKGCKFKKLDFVICNFSIGGKSYQYPFKGRIETLKIILSYYDEKTTIESHIYKAFKTQHCGLKHGTAKSRIQNQLSYKLGQTMIINSKNIFGVLFMPVYIISTLLSHRQEKKIYQEKIKKNPNLKLPPLESYPDYKEALKEKECLTYKLGEALIKANKTWYKGGYVKLIFEIRKLKREFKKKANHA